MRNLIGLYSCRDDMPNFFHVERSLHPARDSTSWNKVERQLQMASVGERTTAELLSLKYWHGGEAIVSGGV